MNFQKLIHYDPSKGSGNNNRKRTRGRIIQEVKLKNKDGEYTGRSKFIRHTF